VANLYPIEPMLLKAARQLPQDEDAWGWEVKYDGYLAIIHVQDGRVRVQSRQLKDMTFHYPKFQALASAVPDGTILDSELVQIHALMVDRP
jgi:bifunctional non-homologous end joining protein LigD